TSDMITIYEHKSNDSSPWYGFKIGEDGLYIGPLPGRKRIAMYHMEGNTVVPLAYFLNEKAALRALGLLDSINRGGKECLQS
ncbi:MAG: hypothetical protein PHZ19_11320, partial [Candidatus Thermoplasmatota archaeon]|nr:hypothetical protein [Candidatus Thermoplasmatota archaeon]